MRRILGVLPLYFVLASMTGAAHADSTIECPLSEVEVELVDRLPRDWSVLPTQLSDTRIERRRGPDSLQCIYDTAMILEISAPRSESCTPTDFGFECVTNRRRGVEAARGPEREREAELVAQSFFEYSSSLTINSLRALERVYAAEVDYFGKRTTRQAILRDKKAFIERWPERSYTIVPGTLNTNCTRNNICEVTGMVNYRTSSRARNATSEGAARFRLGLSMLSQVRVTLESSEVVLRR